MVWEGSTARLHPDSITLNPRTPLNQLQGHPGSEQQQQSHFPSNTGDHFSPRDQSANSKGGVRTGLLKLRSESLCYAPPRRPPITSLQGSDQWLHQITQGVYIFSYVSVTKSNPFLNPHRWSFSYTHTPYTYTHMNTPSHTHTHTFIHTHYSHTLMHSYIHTHTHTHIYIHTLT